MKLKEISEEYQTLYDLASDTDDVVTLTELYNQLEEKLEQKADNVRYVLAKLKSDTEFLQEEIKRFQQRKKSIEKNADNLKSLLMWTLQKAGIDKLKTPKATFYFSTTKSIYIDSKVNIKQLPKEYIQIEYKANKTALKEALNNGIVIDGIKIQENKSLRIR